MIELALGLPIFLLATFYTLALLDQLTTSAGIDPALHRAATVLASTNDDSQAIGAAVNSPYLHSQDVRISFEPPDTARRCPGSKVTITLSAPGHLGFLIPGGSLARARSTSALIEARGTAGSGCPAP